MTLEPYHPHLPWLTYYSYTFRLRLTDVKAEHYERKVATVESERDAWETKYEEVSKKYKAAQEELERFALDLEAI